MIFCFTSKHINLSLHDSYKVSHLLLNLKKYMYFVRRKINLFHGTDIVIYLFPQVVYLSWYWRYSDRDLLVHKPLPKWTSDDVAQWLTDMGAWTQPYLETVNQKDIGRY